MKWYGEEISREFHPGGAEELVADLVVDALEVLAFLDAAPGGEVAGLVMEPGRRWAFVGFGRRISIRRNHHAAILPQER
jgi:hypothetical protein